MGHYKCPLHREYFVKDCKGCELELMTIVKEHEDEEL